MPLPVGSITSMTATGDMECGPGGISILADCLPMACMTDVVAGAACVGMVTVTESLVLIDFRPAATIASDVMGINPETGIPVTTVIAETDAVTMIF